jgi:stage V sporulation protein SpoVS
VSSTTAPNKLAGSIVLVCQGGEAPMLLPMGATCVNQAVKGIAIAKRWGRTS